ncbi:MAG TPA: tetratricopeptide repeat protein [Steroidobacteraceae bacterium]|jgi:tetratricopeptide (TPR) repeat protein|nr:tetratricopeptide repeat protein [Steroidobacteraceae bacterium]
MPSYSVRDVERVLRLSPATTRGLIRAGFVKPARGPRRAYRFSFQDLIVLRTARALLDARIPPKRVRHSLDQLRRELPATMPLSGLAISAVGDHVVVRDGELRWQADSGQYLLGLDVTLENGMLQVVEYKAAPPPAPPAAPAPVAERDWFAEGLTLESTDPPSALAAYRHAAQEDPHNAAAWINWGRLLHVLGKTLEAEGVYDEGRARVGADSLLLFNQAVLLEDIGKIAAALEAYRGALAADPDLADGHYNIARLYESLGKPQDAIRHLGEYRRLVIDRR